MKRWNVEIAYRSRAWSSGRFIDVLYEERKIEKHSIEELSELADIIERGPSWDSIVGFVITLADAIPEMTIDKAEKM